MISEPNRVEDGSFEPIPREQLLPDAGTRGAPPAREVEVAPLRSSVAPGDIVSSLDRGALGTVIAIGPGAAQVEFINRTSGALDQVWMPLGALTLRKHLEERKALKILSFAELMNLEPPKWHIEGLFNEVGLVGVYGPPGCGKSFLVLSFAVATATGVPWFNRTVRQGPVLYIAAEGDRGLPPRLRAALLDAATAEEVLALRFSVIGGAVQFLDPEDLGALLEAIAGLPLPPALVIIDTLARCMAGGDENSARDMGTFVRGCDAIRQRFGSTVIVVHHTGKDGGSERGSSALRGAADTMITVERVEGGLRISCDKQKEGEEFSPIEFTLQQVTVALHGDTDFTTSCRLVARETTAGTSAAPLKQNYVQILTTLLSPLMSGNASKSELQKASGIPSSTFHRVATALVDAGYVECQGEKGRQRLIVTEFGRASASHLSQPIPKIDLGSHAHLPSHPTPLGGGNGREKADGDLEGEEGRDA